MPNDRDTKFLGFAKLLYDELAQNVLASDKGLSDVEAFKQEQHAIIAQRAYDLALHILISDATENLHWIPDLTEWPKTAE